LVGGNWGLVQNGLDRVQIGGMAGFFASRTTLRGRIE